LIYKVYFSTQIHLQNIQVVYQSHRVKAKVTWVTEANRLFVYQVSWVVRLRLKGSLVSSNNLSRSQEQHGINSSAKADNFLQQKRQVAVTDGQQFK